MSYQIFFSRLKNTKKVSSSLNRWEDEWTDNVKSNNTPCTERTAVTCVYIEYINIYRDCCA